ncbi:MAG TPA: hypothetical protein VFA04_22140 [Bryobacteraceae bacterium]|nr:hypothetical protein [Bryobacteraceae bacterium]
MSPVIHRSALLLLLIAQAHAWDRIVWTGSGRRVDVPVAHRLSWFERQASGAELQRIGALAGFPIVSLLSHSLKRKSILVRTGPDRWLEIYHLEAAYVVTELTPVRIVKASDEPVLATMDSDGGNAGGCFEAYWWFDSSGAHEIDFSAVRAGIAKRLAPGARFMTGCANLDLGHQEIRAAVQKQDAECHACGWIGEVTARFRLAGARAESAQISFRPTSQ